MSRKYDPIYVSIVAERNNITVAEAERILNTQYTEEELRKMNLVTQLRAIGRIKGVKSPTTKNMEQLIQCIIAIQDGIDEPEISARGRKVKSKITALSEPTAPYVSPLELYDSFENEGDDDRLSCPTKEEIAKREEISKNAEYYGDSLSDHAVDEHEAAHIMPKEGDTRVSGILEISPDGFGFLRTVNYYQSKNDIYVSAQQIKRFNLRQGDKIDCTARVFDKSRAPSLIFIHTVNDVPCEKLGRRPHFNEFSAAYPNKRIFLSAGADKYDYSLRAIDIVAPVGLGQRGLIVAPPKAGKTTLLKNIARSVIKAYGDFIKVFVLLIDERPEEVTDFQESVPGAEVVYSTFDQTPFHHIAVSELVLCNAKHRVEQGQNVLILLDSITRLARAYNKTDENSGRTLTGGLDIAALEAPKICFGSARRVVNGGSLTILATALVDTGSRMDDIIYEEFKGTGNMEIHLDRELADRRIFPPIDLRKSGTRREEMLLTQKELEGMWAVRRQLADTTNHEACRQLIDMLTGTANNDEFFDTLKIFNKR